MPVSEQLGTPSPEIQSYINEAAKLYGLRPDVLMSVMQSESNFNPRVRDGDNKEIGLMQLLPDTRRDLRISDQQARDPRINTFAGAYWLRQKIQAQGGDVRRGVVAYNGAGKAAEDYGNAVMARLKPSPGTPLQATPGTPETDQSKQSVADRLLSQFNQQQQAQAPPAGVTFDFSKGQRPKPPQGVTFDFSKGVSSQQDLQRGADQSARRVAGQTAPDATMNLLGRMGSYAQNVGGNVLLGAAKASLREALSGPGQAQYAPVQLPAREEAGFSELQKKHPRLLGEPTPSPRAEAFQRGLTRAITPTGTAQKVGSWIPNVEGAIAGLPEMIRGTPALQRLPGLSRIGQIGAPPAPGEVPGLGSRLGQAAKIAIGRRFPGYHTARDFYDAYQALFGREAGAGAGAGGAAGKAATRFTDPGGSLPAMPLPEQLHPEIISPSRSMPGQIAPETVWQRPRSGVVRTPARPGVMQLPGQVEPPSASLARVPVRTRPPAEALKDLSKAERQQELIRSYENLAWYDVNRAVNMKRYAVSKTPKPKGWDELLSLRRELKKWEE